MILLDTSGVLAWVDSTQRLHAETVGSMAGQEGPYLLSPFVLAELDYLLATRVGEQAQHRLLAEVARGAFDLVSMTGADIGRALTVLDRFSNLSAGLADASICVLAERFGCGTLLTLDERRFRVLPGPGGVPLRLLPADA